MIEENMKKYIFYTLAIFVIAIIVGSANETSANNSAKNLTSAVVKVSSPENASMLATLTPTIEWEDLGEAYKYDLILSRTADFSDIILDESNIDGSSYNLSGGLLKYGETYFYKLRPHVSDAESAWSSSYSFSINTVSTEIQFLDSEDMIVSYSQSEGSIELDYELENASNVKVELYDNNGALISYQVYGELNSGVHKTAIDLSSLELGSYLVTVSTANKVTNARISLYQ